MKKKHKQKHESSGIGLLMLTSFAVMLACVGLLALIKIPKPNTSPISSNKIIIRNCDMISINSIVIQNKNGKYTAVNLGNRFIPTEHEMIPYDKKKIAELVEAAGKITAIKQITEVVNLSRYGLTLPLATVKIEYLTEDDINLKIGAKTTEGYYVMINNQIYMLENKAVEPFLWSENQLVSTILTPSKNSNTEITDITLSGTIRSQPIIIQKFNHQYKITLPTEYSISSENITVWTDKIFSLNADEVIKLDPGQQDFVKYGLNKPYSIIDMTTYDSSFSLITSEPVGKFCYIYCEDIPVIYKISTDKLTWLTIQVPMLTGELFTPAHINEVAKLIISTPTASYNYKLTHGEDGYNVKLNDELIAIADFEKLYKLTTTIVPTDYIGNTVPNTKPILKLQIVYTEQERTDDIIYLYPEKNGQMEIWCNGLCEFTTNTTVAQAILACIIH
ncbi:MAG: DUF4340 domain-containing protein [Oscillospiraceae bacterium]